MFSCHQWKDSAAVGYYEVLTFKADTFLQGLWKVFKFSLPLYL